MMAGEQKEYRFCAWTFDPEGNRLESGQGIQIDIEPRVGEFLKYLLDNPARVLSRDELVENAWPSVVSDAAINQAVAKLRKILEDDAKSPVYIETVAKRGYRWIAPVEHEVTPFVVGGSQPAQKTKFLVITLGLLVAVAVLSIFQANIYESGPEAPLPTIATLAEVVPVTSDAGEEIMPAPHPLGGMLAYSGRLSESEQVDLVLASQSGQRLSTLTATEEINELRSAWSPDGMHLAYVAHGPEGCEVRIRTVFADAEAVTTRQVATDTVTNDRLIATCSPFDIQLAWHPNGEDVFFNRRPFAHGPLRIYAVNVRSGRIREITQVNEGVVGDIAFSLSREGEKLAVLRTAHWNQSELWVYDLRNKTSQRLHQFPYWVHSLSWNNDASALYFSRAPFYRELMRYDLKADRASVVIRRDRSIEDPVADPYVATGADAPATELFFVEESFNADIVQLDNPLFSNSNSERVVVNSTRQDWQPLLSPSGQQLAFMSDRSGHIEIWLLDIDSGESRQLSQLKGQLNPYRIQWAPDESSLVFDASDDRLYHLALDGSSHNPMTAANFYARNPRWTNAGLFFSSYMNEDGSTAAADSWQLWRMATAGAKPERVNTEGMFSAEPAVIGGQAGLVYTRFYAEGFWFLPDSPSANEAIIGLREHHSLVQRAAQGPFNQWQLKTSGLYYYATGESGSPGLYHFNFDDSSTRRVLEFNSRKLLSFSISDDERHIFVTRIGERRADILKLQ